MKQADQVLTPPAYHSIKGRARLASAPARPWECVGLVGLNKASSRVSGVTKHTHTYTQGSAHTHTHTQEKQTPQGYIMSTHM